MNKGDFYRRFHIWSIMLCLLFLASCASNSSSCSITIEAKSKGNLIFNKHNYSVAIDNFELLDLPHGDKNSATTRLDKGTHSIVITTNDLKEHNEVIIPVDIQNNNQKYTFTIESKSNSFIVVDATGTKYDSTIKFSVLEDPTSLIPDNVEVFDLDSQAIYDHPYSLEEHYVRTVLVPTECEEGYMRAKTPGKSGHFLVFWHDDYEKIEKPVSVGSPVTIIGVVSGYADSVQIEDCIVDSTTPERWAEILAEKETDSATTLHNLTLSFLEDGLKSKTVAHELQFVCEQIGANINGVSHIEQIENWVGGKQFRFLYTDFDTSDNIFITITCNADSSIQTLRCNGVSVYERGYEAYSLSEYISASIYDISYELYILTQSKIEALLKFPSTAKFDPNYSFTYNNNIYIISGVVSGKNALNMRQELPYKVVYFVKGDLVSIKYLSLDGTEYIDALEDISVPERKKLEIETPADAMSTSSEKNQEIRLRYNELGSYGQAVIYDGIETYEYHVTPGSYRIINNSNQCKVYVATDQYHKNVDGYMENDLIQTIDFQQKGQTNVVSIQKGQHLELTMGADISLVPN